MILVGMSNGQMKRQKRLLEKKNFFMRRAFGKTIVKLAEMQNPNIFLISGDVEQEMDEYKSKFPKGI